MAIWEARTIDKIQISTAHDIVSVSFTSSATAVFDELGGPTSLHLC